MDELDRQQDEERRTLKMKTSTRALTRNDNKVIGLNTNRKRELVKENEKYDTLKMRTYNSTWTPVVHKPSNQQIFNERRDLVSHWFDLWTDTQRKRFFDMVFQQCRRSQYRFIQDWFQEKVPLQHLDFTTVLPAFLSMYIFSFLEPKSLCRAAQACWHWKFLSEQDVIWQPKCMKLGWFLRYKPPDWEFGAWKRHFGGCVKTFDYSTGSDKDIDARYGFRTVEMNFDKQYTKVKRSKSGRLSSNSSRRNMDVRPPWQGTSMKPHDLEKSFYAFLNGVNANDPKLPKSALVLHNKWGIPRKRHEDAVTQSLNFEPGLQSVTRREGHRALTAGDELDLKHTSQRRGLSEVMDLENMQEKRKKELVFTGWKPPDKVYTKQDRTGGVLDTMNAMTLYKGLMVTQHTMGVAGDLAVTDAPRVVFISSRVPAADLIVDAVLFGVIPIVYEYEGTTAQTLMFKLKKELDGRRAKSIGIFTHYEQPGDIKLVENCSVNAETFDLAIVREFFEDVASHIVDESDGGQFHIFSPMAASEPGLDLLIQLTRLTGVFFSSPTGIIGQYNHINTEWLLPYADGSPTTAYFCQSKLDVWANTAGQAKEALRVCKEQLTPFFDKTHKDIVSQLTGQIVFDVMGQTRIHGNKDLTKTLSEALLELGENDSVDPLEFLGKFLLNKAGVEDLTFTSTQHRVSHDDCDQSEEEDEEDRGPTPDEEVEKINGHAEKEHKDDEDDPAFVEEGETMKPRTEYKDSVGDGETLRPPDSPVSEKAQTERSEKDVQRRQRREKKNKMIRQTENLRVTFGSMTIAPGRYQRLTSEKYSENPEKRTPIALEITSSEVEFYRILKGIKHIFVRPLKSSLNSNRAIASYQNVQIIFTDLMMICDISKELVENLKNRTADWDPMNSCLGDIFVKFCTHLKLYTNFVNNYDVILQCIERTKETMPSFRAFLKHNERIPELKMMTLQELLLLPGRRIQEYVTLLSWFECHTPKSHQDRADLANSIQYLKVLNKHIQESKTRLERDRKMIQLQRSILNTPSLLESNRYLLKQLDASHYKPPVKSSVPELKAFQHQEMLGLFLFNDALVITRRTDRHYPFSRAIEHTYRFEVSLSLNRIKISEIPDSKYIQNGFLLETAKREWYCSAESDEERYNWIQLVQQTIRTAI
ncbi:epithelial cell-transforming sequence 2 oncogene-like [Mytilus galloprovincialis]|uniref:epithelial cell-transforming sequence 2 oncogene-like n=1 Tax=Mytilus galloprovincialis TaxID=29158 RepID=UPI003F7B62B6